MKCRKNTESKNLKLLRTKNGRIIILLWKWAVCVSKNSKLIKQQDAGKLLGSLGIKAPLSKIPIVGSLHSIKPVSTRC